MSIQLADSSSPQDVTIAVCGELATVPRLNAFIVQCLGYSIATHSRQFLVLGSAPQYSFRCHTSRIGCHHTDADLPLSFAAPVRLASC